MKENNDGNDANVGSMEKSIKEDIKNGIRIRRILTHEQFEVNSYKV